MLSHGPIAIAILAWQNSIVFHSLDKMTSFFIHIMPVAITHCLRISHNKTYYAGPDMLSAAMGCDPGLIARGRIVIVICASSGHSNDILQYLAGQNALIMYDCWLIFYILGLLFVHSIHCD